LVGPHVLPHRLTGIHSWDFLFHNLPKLLAHVPLAVRERMRYMQDGAPVHFSRAVRDALNNTYHDRRTLCDIQRSPDLNPLDFYLWEHLETLVYAVPVDNEEALHHCILDACQAISNYAGIFERMQRYMMRRGEACIESRRGHFEHLL
jgi:hypothetical protein